MSDDPRARRGRRAEDLAARHLVQQGFSIEARNWRCAVGELDLVVRRDDLLVFVEVRSTTTDWLQSPAETVNTAKQHRVARAADAWLRQQAEMPERIRFDVVAVKLGTFWRADILHIEDAFVPPWAF